MTYPDPKHRATTNIKIRKSTRTNLNLKKLEFKQKMKMRFVSQSDAIDWLILYHDTNN